MTSELMYGVLVVSGLVVLLIAGLLLLARWLEKSGLETPGAPDLPDAQAADSHKLSVAIAEALMERRYIEPSRFNEVAQIVALKIELQKALGAP